MTTSGGAKALAIIVYTLLRVALFALVWLTIELFTPIDGIWAIVVAIMLSGVISIVVLDRPRARVGQVAAGFFGRINDRIDASARAEDVDDDLDGVEGGPGPSGQGEQPAEHESVDKQ